MRLSRWRGTPVRGVEIIAASHTGQEGGNSESKNELEMPIAWSTIKKMPWGGHGTNVSMNAWDCLKAAGLASLLSHVRVLGILQASD